MSCKRWVKVLRFFALERLLDVTQNVYSVWGCIKILHPLQCLHILVYPIIDLLVRVCWRKKMSDFVFQLWTMSSAFGNFIIFHYWQYWFEEMDRNSLYLIITQCAGSQQVNNDIVFLFNQSRKRDRRWYVHCDLAFWSYTLRKKVE